MTLGFLRLKFQAALWTSSRMARFCAPTRDHFGARVILSGASRRLFPQKSYLFDFRVGTRSRRISLRGSLWAGYQQSHFQIWKSAGVV